jgi:uncharacterized protein (TIGR01777 family)
MKVLVTGASGLIGTAVSTALRDRGDVPVALSRGGGGAGMLNWDPAHGELDPRVFDGVDAVVHLAGEGIGEHKWTADQKRRILESRTRGTSLLASMLAGLTTPPKVLVSGSAVGCYGDRGDERLTEESGPGGGFLADVVVQWEQATAAAEAAGIRTVRIRTGIVLARHGGVLASLLTPFKLGIGGRTGPGTQWMSWIALADEVGAILHALDHDRVVGAVNLTAPNPVTNREFTHTLGQALHRPALLPTPLLPLKLRFGGELVRELLLFSQRVRSDKLVGAGYEFRHPQLLEALQATLDPAAA